MSWITDLYYDEKVSKHIVVCSVPEEIFVEGRQGWDPPGVPLKPLFLGSLKITFSGTQVGKAAKLLACIFGGEANSDGIGW